MIVITVQPYKNAEVHNRAVKNKKLFWIKMCDVQKGLDIKNIYDLARKEVSESLKLKILPKNKKENI